MAVTSGFVFNNRRGEVNYYASLPATNDALILVPLEATGLEADDTLNNYDDLASLLAASNNEQTTLGRKTITSTTVTIDDTANTKSATFPAQTYTAATGNQIGAWLVCYDPDTTTGTDSTVIPLTCHQPTQTPGSALVPDGTDITINLPSGFYSA